MALYSYQGLTKDGKSTRGQLDAASLLDAKDQLNKKGIFPTSINVAKEYEAVSLRERLFAKKVKTKDLILFTKQLSILLKSGVPLLDSLDLLTDQFGGQLKNIVVSLKDNIKEGKSLAEGLSKYPKIFDTTYIQLVRAGEASGKLDTILERLADYIERRLKILKRVKSALTYPLIQIIFITAIVVALIVVVIPQMAENFAEQGVELPATTRVLKNTGEFIKNHYLLILFFIALIIFSIISFKRSAYGAKKIDQIKLKIPIVKFFTKIGTVVQFSQTFGMLIEGGVNLSESLDIVYKITTNKILAEAIGTAKDKIIKQGKISQYLKQTGIFPPIAIYLIKTGEETGQLDKMLLIVAKNYEEELTEYTDSLTSKIEPIMILFMALVVGFIVMSIMQPLTQGTQLLS